MWPFFVYAIELKPLLCKHSLCRDSCLHIAVVTGLACCETILRSVTAFNIDKQEHSCASHKFLIPYDNSSIRSEMLERRTGIVQYHSISNKV